MSATAIPIAPLETQTRGGSTMSENTPEQQERQIRIFKRLNQMLEFKRPYEVQMERAYLLYDGISRLNPREPPVIEFSDVVQPFAATFVEAKTAEEYGATSDFQYLALNDDDDAWKVERNMDCVEHVRRKTFAQSKKLDLIRTKNIAGVSIKRKGYKFIMRTMKEPVEQDEYGRVLKWKEEECPWYDDIYEEEVDPFDFVVDPNANNMNVAVDCGQFSRMNWEDAYERFGKDPRFNFDDIKPGMDNMVEFFEYFNAPRDEYCVYAWPSTGSRYSLDHSRKPATAKEIYYGALPDKHKMLPFTSAHCGSSFITGFFFEVIGRSPESGEETSHGENIVGHKVFWTPGVPIQIVDLIDLRTAYGRQALEALKVAATNIIATEGNYRFNNKKKWKNGEQAIGMKGHFEVVNGAQAHVSDFEFHFDDLYNQMVQRTGIDPRNVNDTKQKTLGQDIAERESAAKRLNAEIEYNEIVEGCRDGMITYKLIQEHYTKMEYVRLSGTESVEYLEKNYDETKGIHPLNGGALIGKRYRRISTKTPYSEVGKGENMMLKKDENGKFAFPARKEWIETSDVDIIIVPKKRAGQIQALLKQQANDDVQLWLQVFPLTQPNPQTGAEGVISIDDLPNFKRLSEKWVLADGGNLAKDMGNNSKKSSTDKVDEAMDTHLNEHQPFSTVEKNTSPTAPAGTQTPQQPLPTPATV